MKASILFITYQHEKFVAESIRAAMAQDHPDLELVICDDGSSDRTRRILEEEMARCPRHIEVVWASTDENRGLHANFNGGLAACTGDVIVIMSGDDISLPHRVSKICGVFSADPECMLVCSNWLRINEAGADLGIRGQHTKDTVFSYAGKVDRVYASAPVCGATGSYRASLRSLFPPMAKGRHGEDNCFWVRACWRAIFTTSQSRSCCGDLTRKISPTSRAPPTPRKRSVIICGFCDPTNAFGGS